MLLVYNKMSKKLPRSIYITPYYLNTLRDPVATSVEGIEDKIDNIPHRNLPYRWKDRRNLKPELLREWKHTDHPKNPLYIKDSDIPGAGMGVFSKRYIYSGQPILCDSCESKEAYEPLLDSVCFCPVAFPRDLGKEQYKKLTKRTRITFNGRSMYPYYYTTRRNAFEPKSKDRPRTTYSVMGCILSLVNHCCKPNIRVYEIKTENGWVWMAVTLRKISPGEELYWNYGDEYFSESESVCTNPFCCDTVNNKIK